MKTLMTNLEVLGFTKEHGLNGLSLDNVAVSMHWSGEEAVVAVDGKQVFSSENESEVIEFVKSEISKNEISKTNDQYDAEVLAAEVAKNAEMKYYAEEDNRGKAELIKNALNFINETIPKTIKFSEFQKLVEYNLSN